MIPRPQCCSRTSFDQTLPYNTTVGISVAGFPFLKCLPALNIVVESSTVVHYRMHPNVSQHMQPKIQSVFPSSDKHTKSQRMLRTTRCHPTRTHVVHAFCLVVVFANNWNKLVPEPIRPNPAAPQPSSYRTHFRLTRVRRSQASCARRFVPHSTHIHDNPHHRHRRRRRPPNDACWEFNLVWRQRAVQVSHRKALTAAVEVALDVPKVCQRPPGARRVVVSTQQRVGTLWNQCERANETHLRGTSAPSCCS